MRFTAPSVKDAAGWLWQASDPLQGHSFIFARSSDPEFSPKWRRQTLPDRWMRPESINCRMTIELHTIASLANSPAGCPTLPHPDQTSAPAQERLCERRYKDETHSSEGYHLVDRPYPWCPWTPRFPGCYSSSEPIRVLARRSRARLNAGRDTR
jgi:hypothetical protein